MASLVQPLPPLIGFETVTTYETVTSNSDQAVQMTITGTTASSVSISSHRRRGMTEIAIERASPKPMLPQRATNADLCGYGVLHQPAEMISLESREGVLAVHLPPPRSQKDQEL